MQAVLNQTTHGTLHALKMICQWCTLEYSYCNGTLLKFSNSMGCFLLTLLEYERMRFRCLCLKIKSSQTFTVKGFEIPCYFLHTYSAKTYPQKHKPVTLWAQSLILQSLMFSGPTCSQLWTFNDFKKYFFHGHVQVQANCSSPNKPSSSKGIGRIAVFFCEYFDTFYMLQFN